MRKAGYWLLMAIFTVLNLSPGWAGSLTNNGFIYRPDLGARGSGEKNAFDAGLNRIDARLGKEIWVGDPNYGTTLQDALSAIGSNNRVLKIPAGTHNISADLSIPANITLEPQRGAVLTVADTKTLTINGGLEAGPYQIFSCAGAGKVVFGSGVKEVYPQWWGARGDNAADDLGAIQAAVASHGRVNFGAAAYYLSARVDLPLNKNLRLRGQGAVLRRDNTTVGSEALSPIFDYGNAYKQIDAITAKIDKGSDLVSIASTVNYTVGDVVFIYTDEVYSVRGAGPTTYKKYFGSEVTEIVNSTQVRLADKAPYDFNVAGYSPVLRLCYGGRNTFIEIDGLQFTYTGGNAYIATNALSLSDVFNLTVKNCNFTGHSTSGIKISGAYNITLDNLRISSDTRDSAKVGYGCYGLLLGNIFNSNISNCHIAASEHALTAGAVCWNLNIDKCYLVSRAYSGSPLGRSFDSHCAERVYVRNSYLPQGATASGGYFYFENCFMGLPPNLPGAAVVGAGQATFLRGLTLKNCEMVLYSTGYVWAYGLDSFMTDLPTFVMEGCKVRANASETLSAIVAHLAYTHTLNSIGSYTIRNNEFLVDMGGSSGVIAMATTGNVAATRSLLTIEDNKFQKMSILIRQGHSLLWHTAVIRGNIGADPAKIFNLNCGQHANNIYVENNQFTDGAYASQGAGLLSMINNRFIARGIENFIVDADSHTGDLILMDNVSYPSAAYPNGCRVTGTNKVFVRNNVWGLYPGNQNSYIWTATPPTEPYGGLDTICKAGAPNFTPLYKGQRYIDTTNGKEYVATGTSGSGDWKILN